MTDTSPRVPEPPLPPVLDAVSVICSDMARSAAFYRALGLPVPLDAGDQQHVDIDLGAGNRMMLDSEEVVRSLLPDDSWSGGGGRLTLAARCPDAGSVDRMHDELVPLGAGSLVAPFDAPWGQRYATVLDPDGARIDLYADTRP